MRQRSAVPDEYRDRMRRKVAEADEAHRETSMKVTMEVSRQLQTDLIEAFNQLNSMNPWYRGIARRLRDHAIAMRDALDRAGSDGQAKTVTKDEP